MTATHGTATNRPTHTPGPMVTTTSCPGCGKETHRKSEHIGKRAKCPDCGTVHVLRPTVPGQSDLQVPVADFPVLDPGPPAPRPLAAQATPGGTAATSHTPDAPTRSPRTWDLQVIAAGMFLAGMSAFALGFSGPSDIQLLGFWGIAAALASGGITVSAIARAIGALSR